MYAKYIESLIQIECFLVSGHCLFTGMWYTMPSNIGKLPKFGYFDVAHVMILEDQYSHIMSITAKEGKIQFGLTEDHICDP